jgi:IS30 family transposase
MIDQRPQEAADREVAGHWEGDLITGQANRSAIGTLVERSCRYTILLYLPAGTPPTRSATPSSRPWVRCRGICAGR